MLNFNFAGEFDQKGLQNSLKDSKMNVGGTLYNSEKYKAKRILKAVKAQVINKHLFNNKITIRYENMIKDIDSELIKIGQKFNIEPNIDKAKDVLLRPSRSSRKNRYDIKSISNRDAKKMVIEACSSWNYDYYTL